MSWRDALLFAARSVRRRLGRAALTVLAVALASALLSSLLIAGGVARSRVLDAVTRGGPLTGIKVDAAEPDISALDSDVPTRKGPPRSIDDRAIRRIRALRGVRSVNPVLVHPIFVLTPDPAVTPTADNDAKVAAAKAAPQFFDGLVGVDIAHAANLPVTVLAGRLPVDRSATEVAVTPSYLRRLGLRQAQAAAVVGTEIAYGSPRVFANLGRDTVRGRWTRAEIVGVVAQEAGSGSVLAPIQQVTAARRWTQASDGDIDFLRIPDTQYSALFVVAGELDQVGPVRVSINRVGYSTSAPESLIANVQRYVHVVEIVLGSIGLIGLVIAALGISNAMLAAVRERRREIGVLKAIGARDRDVRRAFLFEAGMLGGVGGLLGTIAGYLIARALAAVVNGYLTSQGLAGVHVAVPLAVIAGGVVGATVLALVAGTIPAQRAARMPARRAMGEA